MLNYIPAHIIYLRECFLFEFEFENKNRNSMEIYIATVFLSSNVRIVHIYTPNCLEYMKTRMFISTGVFAIVNFCSIYINIQNNEHLFVIIKCI